MTPRTAFCGIDVGTQGVRAVLVDEEGRELATGAAAIPPGHRAGERHEQDPATWWAALCVATRAACGAVPDVRVAALALDATSGTVLPLDGDGRPRGPALMYDDGRATAEGERAQRAGAALWAELGYRVQPSWALPKVLWLQEHTSPVRVVHQADHLVGLLAGRPVATDTSTALKTGVDLRVAAWPVDVFAELGIQPGLLPEVVLPGTVLGEVCARSADATGLPVGTPIRAGMTDGCAAQIASGALASGRWASALGTTLVVKGSTAELVRDPAGVVYSHRHPDGGWLPGGASSTGAGALRAAFPDATPADLDRLTAEAAALVRAPGVSYPLVGRGERFPFRAPTAEGFLDPEAVTPAERFAAVCQGIALAERLAFDVLRVLGAAVSGPVALTGGATGNRWWNQLRADALGRPTVTLTSAGAATGMAVLAAAEPGQLTATAERMVTTAERYEVDPDRSGALAGSYVSTVTELVDRGWLDQTMGARVLTLGPVAA